MVKKWMLPVLILLFAGCSTDRDQQAQVQFAEIVQEFRDTEEADEASLSLLKQRLDLLIESHKSAPVVQQLLQGEAIIMGMSLAEVDSKVADAMADRAARDYARFFVDIITERCLPYLNDLESLTLKLESDKKFRADTDLEGTFETNYNGASFALTPDAASATCTVDVMLVTDNHDQLFTPEHIDRELKAISESSNSIFIESTTYGSNGNQIKILEKEYVMPGGAKLKLLYPSTAFREFFMQVNVIAPLGAGG